MASWFGVRAKTPPVDPAAAQAANGRPLLLIGLNDQTKQWELGADAMSVLKNVRGPLCTISVCGRARQGKSFLLNQMLTTLTGVSMQKPKGFTVSPTHQSCTRGIWIWSAPIPVTAADGTKLNTVRKASGQYICTSCLERLNTGMPFAVVHAVWARTCQHA